MDEMFTKEDSGAAWMAWHDSGTWTDSVAMQYTVHSSL